MMGGRPLPAGELRSELQAVAEQVVEVLHPIIHQIPLCPVTDACTELVTVTQTFPKMEVDIIYFLVFACSLSVGHF